MSKQIIRPDTRVTALLCVDGDKVYSFGDGTYVGDEVPPPEINPEFRAAMGELGMAERPNPKIDLDSGKTVWGCECWWGPADEIKSKFPEDKFDWINVDIEKEREAPGESVK
jgi:hypothetical protein